MRTRIKYVHSPVMEKYDWSWRRLSREEMDECIVEYKALLAKIGCFDTECSCVASICDKEMFDYIEVVTHTETDNFPSLLRQLQMDAWGYSAEFLPG